MNEELVKLITKMRQCYHINGNYAPFYEITIAITTWKIFSDCAGAHPPKCQSYNIPVAPEEYRFSSVMNHTVSDGNQQRLVTALEKWEEILPSSMKGLTLINLNDINSFPKESWITYCQLWLDLSKLLDEINLIERIGKIMDALESASKYEGSMRPFFTPKNVRSMMIELLDPQEESTVFDPYCRTGDLLEEASKKTGNRAFLYGIAASSYDKRWTMARLMPSNLRGDLSIHQNILWAGPLKDKKFDYIISNPPFGMSAQVTDAGELYSEGEWADLKYKTNRSDILFVAQALDCLSPKGKAAIVLPGVFLSGIGAFSELRERIIRKNLLDAVINLPSGIFYSSWVTATILIFNKNRQHEKVFLFDAGYDSQRTVGSYGSVQLNPDTTAKLIQQFRSQDFSDNAFTTVTDTQEIAANGYDFRYSVYDPQKNGYVMNDTKPVNQLLTESNALEEELKQVRLRIANLLKK